MKRYVFEITVTEGYDEFWESLESESGCDEILEEVKIAFDRTALNPEIKLVEYTDK